MKLKMADTVVGIFFFLIEFKVFFLIISKYAYIIWVGSETLKFRSWIRNKSFLIHNTGLI